MEHVGGVHKPDRVNGAISVAVVVLHDLQHPVDATVRYVKASAQRTCDGTTLLGNNNPGEYQYRIRASDGQIAKEMETNNYGRVTGESHSLDRSENQNFTNQTWKFSNLTQDETVGLWLYSTEWDGTQKDD